MIPSKMFYELDSSGIIIFDDANLNLSKDSVSFLYFSNFKFICWSIFNSYVGILHVLLRLQCIYICWYIFSLCITGSVCTEVYSTSWHTTCVFEAPSEWFFEVCSSYIHPKLRMCCQSSSSIYIEVFLTSVWTPCVVGAVWVYTLKYFLY